MNRGWLRSRKPERPTRSAPHAEWLEPRLLYSADMGGLLAATAAEAVAQTRTVTPTLEYTGMAAATPTDADVRSAYALTPMQFETNAGQLGEGVDYAASGVGYAVRLGGGQAELLLDGADQPVRLQLVGAAPGTAIGENPLASRSNWLVGQDPSKWVTDIANYGSVRYQGVYDGIDVRYYGNQSQLEYDFLVAAGADASKLQLHFDGADKVSVDTNGDLVLRVSGTDRDIRFQAPVSYQDGPNGREGVGSHYAIQPDGTVKIVVDDYDHTRALVVDPVLSHASYYGDTAAETALGVAVGNDGSVYVTGQTLSTGGMFGTRLASGSDSNEAYVAKFNADLTSLVYATRVGGGGNEEGTSVAVDSGGNAIVTGWTTSNNFVGVTATSDQAGLSGSQDAFVFKLNSAGNGLVFSTYFGGSGNSDVGSGVAVDASDNIYVAGTVSGSSDNAFLNKYTASGASVFKVQYGGSAADSARGVALDSSGNIYVAGNTLSDGNKIVNGAQATRGGTDDGFLVRYDATGTLQYATYIGSANSDFVTGVATDDTGRAYVVGRTVNPSGSGFATTAGAFQTTAYGDTMGYVRVYNTGASGASSLEYSSLLGGWLDATGNTSPSLVNNSTGVAVLGGQVAIAGTSTASNFPTTADAISRSNTSGTATGFVTVIRPLSGGAADQVYGTYYGKGLTTGAVTWANNRVYLVGSTGTAGLATSDGYRTTVAGSTDGVVAAFGGFANTAPVLGGTNNLASQLEDVPSPGTLVSDLVAGKITDADPGAAKGIAVIGVDTSKGSWQYSLNNGGTWSTLANPLVGNALLLNADAQTRVRFVPNANYNGTTGGITFRAWDRTQGFSGATVAVTTTGGSSAFSTATAMATVTVTPVNDAPVRIAGTLGPVSVQEGLPAVSLGLGTLSYAPGPATATDEVSQNLTYTVTGLPGGVGTVQLADGTAVTLNTAYTLPQLQTMIFKPGAVGSATFTFSVKDDGGTANGGQDTLSQSVTVTVVNLAPVLTTPANPLTAQLEDVPGNGTLVSDIITGKVSDAGGKYGIAVVGMPNGNINGTWQYSLDGGTTWLSVSGTTSSSLLLAGDSLTRVRFLSNANWNGNVSGFTFRAWDQSSGVNGGTADTTLNGGTTAFSSASTTASLTVTPVNDAPFRYNVSTSTVLPAPSNVTVNEGSGLSSLGLGYLQYIPGPSVDEYNTQSIIAYTVTAVPGAGVGTVYLSDGVTAVAPGSYTLAQIQGMQFKAAAGVQVASGTLSWSIKDNGGTANGGIDTLYEAITVAVQNVAPVLSGTNNLNTILEDTPGTGTLVSDLVSGKITDPSGNVAIAVAGVNTTCGSWDYTTNSGSTWSSLNAATPTASILLNADKKTFVRFTPNANWNGTTSGITFRAWDRSTGTVGGTANTTVNGGTTAFSAASATASITVTPVNDAPVRTAGTINPLIELDGSPTASLGLGSLAYAPGPPTATDEAGQTLTYTVTGLPTASGVSLGQVLLADGKTVVTLNTQYTLTQIQGMQFKSAGLNVLGSSALTFTVQDNGGTANGGADTLVQSVPIIVNRAPVLNGANNPLTVYEDFNSSGGTPQGTPPAWANPTQRLGMLVSDITANQVTDTPGSLSGIAITGLTGSGTWQYSLDGGNNWTTIAAASNTSATLLGADTLTRVRFLPSANWNSAIGTAGVTFRAWDQSTGTAGSTADTSWNGGASPYSASSATSIVTVIPVNDAPVAIGTPTATSVVEGGAASTLGLAGVSYAPGPATATDEAGQTLTYTVASIPGTLVNVTLADGVTPVTVGTSYTLAQFQGMLYTSAPGAIPGTGTFSFNVQDNGGTANGGVDTRVQKLTLTVLNKAPVLNGANPMTGILEDQPGNGTLVSDLIAGQITDYEQKYGIAVTSVDNANGNWQYSIDGGTSWLAFGTPTASSARLLAGDALTRVRFAPNQNWNGTSSFTFDAWDETSGTNGGTANATVVGGATAFSGNNATSSIVVTAVNDTPALTAGSVANLAVLEDSGSTSLGLGSVSYGPGGGSDEATQTLTYTVTGLPSSSLGQVTLLDGTPVAAGDYTLAQLRGMRFVTSPNATGASSFSFQVRDNGGTANGGIDTLAQTIQIGVAPVNDAPVLTAGAVSGVTVAEDSGSTSLGLGSIAYGPGGGPDEAGQTLTYSVTTLPPASLGQITLANGTPVVAGTYALADIQGMRFQTASNANGFATFGFQVQDNGGTANGGNDTLAQSLTINVTPVNDPPVVATGTVSNLTVAEDSGATSLGLGSVSYGPGGGPDEASQTLSYTVTQVPAAGAGQIQLADGTPVTAGTSYTLTQLQGMQFATVPNANGSSNFAWLVTDSGGATLAQSMGITVTPVNDPPVAGAGSVSVLRGGTVNGAVSYTDPDLPNDTETVSLVTAPRFGSLVLNADGSFSYTHDNSGNFSDAFVFQVTDAAGASSQATESITVTQVANNPPVAQAGTATVAEGGTVTGAVAATDADLPGDTLTYSLVTSPAHGALTFNADGTYSYAHDGSENFSDAFTYRVTDSQGATSQAGVSITITPVNDNAPVAQSATATLAEGGTMSGTVLATDADLPNDTLTYALLTGPAHGSLTFGVDGSYTYTHDSSENFSDGFTWQVADAAGHTSQASVGFTITPVNDNAPVAQPGTAAVAEGGTVTGAVTATDADLPNDTLTYSLLGAPAHGTLTFNADGTYSYTHDDSETFSDAFSWKVTDAVGHASQSTVAITIAPVNDNAPVAQASTLTVQEGGSASGAVVATDADLPNDTLTLSLLSGPAHGGLVFNADGSYTYTHDSSENFADAFTWQAVDAAGHASQATVGITITPVNDNAPVAQASTTTVAEGGTATGSLVATDADLPYDTLSYSLLSAPAHGTLTLNADGSYSYTHDSSENFSDGFSWQVTDAVGHTGQSSVTITITPVNDNVPVAQASTATVAEGGTVAGTVTATDADLPNDSLTYALLSGPSHGTLTFNADGSYSYTHDDSENLADGFAWQVTDAVGHTSQSSVGITITPVNDNAPVAQSSTTTVAEGGTVTGAVNATDADLPNDTLTYALLSGPAHGSLTFNADGSYSYTHDSSENFSDAFSWQVTDAVGHTSQSSVGITITPVNDNAPIAQSSGATVAEGGTVAGAVTATDADLPNDTLTYALLSRPAHGALTFNADGSYSYTHDSSENFSDAFTWQVTDAVGHTSQSSVAITITPVNDNAPVAQASTTTVAEGGTVTAAVNATDADLPNDTLTYALLTGPAHGALTFNADGSYSYTHDSSENFSDGFTWQVTDAVGHTSQSSVGITITPVNDNAPVAQASTTTVAEGGTVAGTVTATDADLPNDSLTYSLLSGPAHGTLTFNADGTYSYTHDDSENLSDGFAWQATDAVGHTSQSSVGITVTPVNDNAPVASSVTATVAEGGTIAGTVAVSDADLPNDTLTLSLVSGPAHGLLTFNADGSYSYANDSSENFTDGFTYQVTDAVGHADQGTISFNITPVNDNAPVAQASTTTVAEGGTIAGAVTATDADLPNDTLTYALLSGPAHGSLTFNADGSYSYTHDSSENFADAFTWQVTDAVGHTSQSSVGITITPVNDNAPVAQSSGATVAEGGTVAGAVTATDTDLPNDTLTYALLSGPAHGALTFNADGSYSYIHDSSENFSDAFSWQVTDAVGHTSQSSVGITITPVNDNAPVAQAGTASVAQGGTVASAVAATDTDMPNDTLTYALLSGPTHGTLAFRADGSYTYTQDGSSNLSDAFTWQVTDAVGHASQSTVAISIAPDHAPLAQAGTATVAEGGTVAGAVTATDADLPNDTLTYALLSAPVHGTLTFNADGAYSYAHDGSENFADTFVFQVTDALGAASQASVAIAVTPVNDNVPIAQASTTTVGEGGTVAGAVTATDADLPNDTLAYALLSGPAHGSLAFNADGTYTYTHDGSETTSDSFAWSVTDAVGHSSQGTAGITIVNQAPTLAGANPLGTILEDTPDAGTLVSSLIAGQAADPGGTLGIAVVSAQSAGGQWQFSRDGGSTWSAFANVSGSDAELLPADAQARVRFVPGQDWNGTDTGLAFRAWDQSGTTAGLQRADTTINGGSSPFSINVANASQTVTAVNDAPVASSSGPAVVLVASGTTTPSSLQLQNWNYVPGGGSDEASQTLGVTLTGLPPASAGAVVLADGTTAAVPGATYTLDQFRGMQFVAAANAPAGNVQLAWVVQDNGGTAWGGVDQVAGGLTIQIPAATNTAAPAPAPAPVVAAPAAPSPAPVASPVAAPPAASAPAVNPAPAVVGIAPAPTLASTIAAVSPALVQPASASAAPLGAAAPAPASIAGHSVTGVLGNVGESLLDTANLLSTVSGFAPDQFTTGSGAGSGTGIPPELRALHGEIELGLGLALGGDFRLIGFTNAEAGSARMTVEQAQQVLRSAAFVEELDRMRRRLRDEFNLDRTAAIEVAGLSLGVSLVYVLWLIRGGVLLGSYLSALPAWRLLDPLPVLARAGDDEDDEDEPLSATRPMPVDPLRGFA